MWVVIEWLSTLVSFGGTLAVAKHHHWGWLLGVAADFGFVVFALKQKLYGFLSLCFGYMVINLIGWFS
jgi:nicotinamide riboside transporter PnuC